MSLREIILLVVLVLAVSFICIAAIYSGLEVKRQEELNLKMLIDHYERKTNGECRTDKEG